MASSQLTADDHQRPLTALVYAILWFLLTTSLYVLLFARYNHHLAHTGQFSWLRTVDEYSTLTESLLYSVQLLVALAFFRPLKRAFGDGQKGNLVMGGTLKEAGWGALGGVLAFAIGVPGPLGRDGYQGLGTFLVDHLYGPSGILLLVISIFLLPILSEGFFRGVLLRRLMQNVSPPAAVLATALLFAFFWPTFTFIPCLTLGLVAGILFYRTRSLIACIVANSVFMTGAVVFVMWRAL